MQSIRTCKQQASWPLYFEMSISSNYINSGWTNHEFVVRQLRFHIKHAVLLTLTAHVPRPHRHAISSRLVCLSVLIEIPVNKDENAHRNIINIYIKLYNYYIIIIYNMNLCACSNVWVVVLRTSTKAHCYAIDIN